MYVNISHAWFLNGRAGGASTSALAHQLRTAALRLGGGSVAPTRRYVTDT